MREHEFGSPEQLYLDDEQLADEYRKFLSDLRAQSERGPIRGWWARVERALRPDGPTS